MLAGWSAGRLLRCIAGFELVEMAIAANPKPVIYRNYYQNTGPVQQADHPLLRVIYGCTPLPELRCGGSGYLGNFTHISHALSIIRITTIIVSSVNVQS